MHLNTGLIIMDYDTNKVDDAVLALLSLTVHQENEFGARSWKGHDWETLNRLHEKGMIGDPVSKAKSVVLTPEGLAKSRELFQSLFANRHNNPMHRSPRSGQNWKHDHPRVLGDAGH